MIVVQILIGLLGLGVVVFIHELGHMLAAKAVGIEVEAFSLGWGRKLVGFTRGGTEYRISAFPVGGYCKMKGEQSYTQALENNEDTIPAESGSFFGAAPWRRIVTLLAGPVSNIILAIFILSIVWWAGFSIESSPNRIVLGSEYADLVDGAPSEDGATYPADAAALETGDVVTSINDRPVNSFGDLQQIVARNALTPLEFAVQRDGQSIEVTVTPDLDTETGAGVIGVYPWVEPVISAVEPDSLAAQAGFQSGDRIVAVDGTSVPHVFWELRRLLEASGDEAEVTVSREGSRTTFTIPTDWQALYQQLTFARETFPTPDYNVFQAIGRGTVQSFTILVEAVRSLRLLFQGVQLRSAVAGPIRIGYYIGEAATSGFRISVAAGLRSFFQFVALLSVVLFFMNLLPIPVLDGGQIVLASFEWARGKKPHPRTIYRYQLVGSIFVFGLLFFALFGDILFIAGR